LKPIKKPEPEDQDEPFEEVTEDVIIEKSKRSVSPDDQDKKQVTIKKKKKKPEIVPQVTEEPEEEVTLKPKEEKPDEITAEISIKKTGT